MPAWYGLYNLRALFNCFMSAWSISETYNRQYEDCKDSLDFFVPPSDVTDIATKYQQWQTINKKVEKVQINATVGDIFEDLKSQLTVFLTHCYVKRIQASHMENLISSCDGKMKSNLDIGITAKLLCLQPMHGYIKTARKALSSFLMISIIP